MTIRNQRFSLLKQPIFSILNQHLINYPTPSNLNYWAGFGPLAGICLVIQIVTGVFLAMHYTPHVDLAFNSVEHIMRDVEGGWFLRYMHANGARYVPPWGQMSFWGATVITSLASAIPVVGDTIVTWLWGGWVAFAIFSSIFIFYAPNVLGHPDNYIPANPMPTPPHIVPECFLELERWKC
ncbi:hypothetical protein AG4045_014394 [Apium graveolens]|uniref:Cytochrome b n=1 Tax=Apium graveolens TaxID=4045 RepID=A0A6L5BAG8_APIGR|nr:hypothetical protein AG4045_014394 [Apium graveolens]